MHTKTYTYAHKNEVEMHKHFCMNMEEFVENMCAATRLYTNFALDTPY